MDLNKALEFFGTLIDGCQYLSFERDYDIENVPWCGAMSTAVEDLPVTTCPHPGCPMNPKNRAESFDLIGILNGTAERKYLMSWSQSEIERRHKVETGKAVVAKIKSAADADLIEWAESSGKYVYIGRRSLSNIGWGNPFKFGKDGNRDQVCDDHIKYLDANGDLLSKIDSLKGKVLGCHCYPKRCHGDYLASLANQQKGLRK